MDGRRLLRRPFFLPILVRCARPRLPHPSSSAASIAPVGRLHLLRPIVALDLALTSVATRRRKIRSTFQNKNKACMKNKTYQRPANQRPAIIAVYLRRSL